MALIRAASVKLGGLDPWLSHQYALTLIAAEQYGPASDVLALLAAKVPANAQVRLHLGQCADLVGEYVTAKDHYRAATRLHARDASQPDACRAWFGLGSCLYRLGRPDEGEAAWLIGLDADCHSTDARFQRSNVLLAMGRYEEGWKEYEARLEMRGVKDSLKARGVDVSALPPAWDGQAQGRVMVLGTQGAGDCIQFSRYLPHVEKRSGFTPYLIAGAPLASFLGYDVPYWCDWSVYLDSLPLVLGMPEPIPPVDRALFRCSRRIAFKTYGKSAKQVGVCWKGSSQHRNDLDRSSPTDFREAFASDDYELVSLQAGEDFTPKDYRETADLIATLDAVVTVDTSVAHVAGTLGVPTIVIPPTCPEYRWGTKGTTSPWYPSVRLVRRKKWDDWPGVIERTKVNLAGML
jgi:tetratricopeptide (TPR) repeat protein